jgi:hypothetical protein
MLPLEFPDPMEEAARRAREFQRLSPEERWREMAALMAFGWAMVRSSPQRDVIEKRMQEQELQWRKIQKELFARHGG